MQLSDVVRIALIFSEDAKRYAKKLAAATQEFDAEMAKVVATQVKEG